jgi:hypothetical protein
VKGFSRNWVLEITSLGRSLWCGDLAATQSEDPFLQAHFQECISIAQVAALSDDSLIHENAPEILAPWQEGGDRGESLEGMYAPGCESLDQSRIPGRTGGPATASVVRHQYTWLTTSK